MVYLFDVYKLKRRLSLTTRDFKRRLRNIKLLLFRVHINGEKNSIFVV